MGIATFVGNLNRATVKLVVIILNDINKLRATARAISHIAVDGVAGGRRDDPGSIDVYANRMAVYVIMRSRSRPVNATNTSR